MGSQQMMCLAAAGATAACKCAVSPSRTRLAAHQLLAAELLQSQKQESGKAVVLGWRTAVQWLGCKCLWLVVSSVLAVRGWQWPFELTGVTSVYAVSPWFLFVWSIGVCLPRTSWQLNHSEEDSERL
jgi:hypothetical protein